MQTATALLLPWSPCTLAQTRPNNVSIIRLSFPNQAQFSWPRNTTTFSLNCSLNEGLPQDPGKGFWNNWKVNSAEMRSKLAKLGLAAVLAYGLFDGVTYTSFFVLAFLGYEKSTGNNPAANLKALLGATTMAAPYLPEEVIEEILSRVPLKSLARFTTVCKKWYFLLSQDDKFAKFYMKQSSRKFNIPVEISRHYTLIGSANGFICISIFDKGCCYLWNPCTGEYKKIFMPLHSAGDHIFGFRYDPSSNDYNIIAGWDSHFRIFSFKTNSWKKLFKYYFSMKDKCFDFNGALHWHVDKEIIGFDLVKEDLFFIKLPTEIRNYDGVSLHDYKGSLCATGHKSIWIMKEYRDAKSWVKFMNYDFSQIMTQRSTFAFPYIESLISLRGFDSLSKSEKMTTPRKQRKINPT